MNESHVVDAGLDRLDRRRRAGRTTMIVVFAVAFALVVANVAYGPVAAYYEQIQADRAIAAGNPGAASLHELLSWGYAHHYAAKDLMKIATAGLAEGSTKGAVAMPTKTQCDRRISEVSLVLNSPTAQPPTFLRAGLLNARAECYDLLHRNDLAYADYVDSVAARNSLLGVSVQSPSRVMLLLWAANAAAVRGDVSVAKRLVADARHEDPTLVAHIKKSVSARPQPALAAVTSLL